MAGVKCINNVQHGDLTFTCSVCDMHVSHNTDFIAKEQSAEQRMNL